jgi:hypothetical protein
METLHSIQDAAGFSVAQRIRDALIARGSSLGKWADANGHKRETAYSVVRNWAGKNRQPLGGIGRQIIKELRAELGTEILPDPAATDGSPSRRQSVRSRITKRTAQ